jgi:hypothetical protein
MHMVVVGVNVNFCAQKKSLGKWEKKNTEGNVDDNDKSRTKLCYIYKVNIFIRVNDELAVWG